MIRLPVNVQTLQDSAKQYAEIIRNEAGNTQTHFYIAGITFFTKVDTDKISLTAQSHQQSDNISVQDGELEQAIADLWISVAAATLVA